MSVQDEQINDIKNRYQEKLYNETFKYMIKWFLESEWFDLSFNLHKNEYILNIRRKNKMTQIYKQQRIPANLINNVIDEIKDLDIDL